MISTAVSLEVGRRAQRRVRTLHPIAVRGAVACSQSEAGVLPYRHVEEQRIVCSVRSKGMREEAAPDADLSETLAPRGFSQLGKPVASLQPAKVECYAGVDEEGLIRNASSLVCHAKLARTPHWCVMSSCRCG